MKPERWPELASTIADGVQVGPGTKVSITVTAAEAAEPVRWFVAEVYRRGAVPQVVWADASFDHSALRYAAPEQLEVPAPVELAALAWSDVHVAFRAMTVPPTEVVPAERAARLRRGKGAVSAQRWHQDRWVVVRVPTPQWAQLAGLDPATVQEEFLAGTIADWASLRVQWDALAAQLNATRTVRITSPDTDLSCRVEDRTWVVFAGEANLPDGELATAPVDDSMQGHITFPGRFWFADVAIEDLELTFQRGEVVQVAAAQGVDFARALISSDPGARRVGELGIGLNAAVRTMTGDLFVDEKILGTVHLALGRAYPQCGGHNESVIHWDLVKDMRVPARGGPGRLTCDEVLLIDAGVITHPLLRARRPGGATMKNGEAS